MSDSLLQEDGSSKILLEDGFEILLNQTSPDPDYLTRLIFHSNYPAFKNNRVYEGSFSISGTATAGVNDVTETVALDSAPDLLDVIFQGASDDDFEGFYGDQDPRPTDAWFKQGAVWVAGGDGGAYVDYPTFWIMDYYIDGSNLVIRARYVQTFIATLSLTSETVQYKIVDYSVF